MSKSIWFLMILFIVRIKNRSTSGTQLRCGTNNSIIHSCWLHAWPIEKTILQTMDGTVKSVTYGKGILFSRNTATAYRSYDNKKTSSTSQQTAYRCSVCQGVVTKSISSYEQSRKDSGANLSKHNQLDNDNINRSLISKPSPSSGSSSSLSTTCDKRAVLCGVTYGKRNFRLNGTINDVINMKDLLVKNFKFPVDCIRVLTEEEEEQDPNLLPTRRNLQESLKWLVKDCQSGDSLVFYFSGHGLQQPEYHKQDEIDGLDETICPVDFMTEGMITDNELNSTIVWPLKKGVTLHAILDACHSGTILDLKYVYKQKDGVWNWEDNKPRGQKTITKHTSGGLAICLSACEDSQMAANTTVFGGKGMKGVLTNLFTKTIREHHGITYGGLLEKMHGGIGKILPSKYNNSFLKHIFHRKLEQDPLLSSSEKFDVSIRKFTL